MSATIPWSYQLQDGLGAMGYVSKGVRLKPGEAPAERIVIGSRGYLLKTINVKEGMGQAIYHCIMEVI